MSGLSAGEDGEAATGFGASGTGQRSPREMVKEAAENVKSEAATFASEARDRAADEAQGAAVTATRTLAEFASAIKKAGEELSQHDQSLAGKMVKQAGDGLENLARSVADKEPEELMDAARDFGRRNPLAFLAGSVLLGLAAGRFLRSSTPEASSAADGEPRSFSSNTTNQDADDGFNSPAANYVSETAGLQSSPALDIGAAEATSPPRAPIPPEYRAWMHILELCPICSRI